MGGFDEHIRQLNNYNTIFGTYWFNILCVCCNLVEIITSVVLLGYFHNIVTVDYIWWPLIEMIRLFILTILRFDVMLKGVENYNDNRTGFKYTKRMIILCNLIGFFIILIGAPIYLALLSTPTNSLYAKSSIYTIFMSIYPSFILIRICLTLPMYCTLLIGTNPLYAINHGYQRIDDGIANRHRRRTSRRRSHGDGYEDEERESHEDRVQRQMRRQWRLMQLEQRQMQLAMEQSRQDQYRSTVNEQDKEYERALKEAKDNNEPQIQTESNNLTNNNNAFSSNTGSEYDIASPMDFTPAQSDDIDIGINGMGISDHYEDALNEDDVNVDVLEDENYNEMFCNEIELDAMESEVEDSEECVSIRIRLPNGIRSERRFHFRATIGDIVLWTQYECKKHGQLHLINHSQLISTMPHTVYNDKNKNLKELRFWRPNAKRKIVSPLLYVEEL